jgi:hypothetical protein
VSDQLRTARLNTARLRGRLAGTMRHAAALASGRLRGVSDLAWLDEAGTAVGTTLDLARTAQELADITVPRLADSAAVDMLESVLQGEEGARAAKLPLLRAVAVASVLGLRELEAIPVGEVATTEAGTSGSASSSASRCWSRRSDGGSIR